MPPLPQQPKTLGAPRTPTARFGTIVVHDLVTAIVVGDFQAGELLPSETELCDHFGVSRTVIRESIKRLEEKGMVSVAQGRGTVVTKQHDWNILDRVVLTVMIENDAELGILDEIATVRAELESGMAGRAAARRDDAAIGELVAAHEHLEATIADAEEFAASDVEFHAAVMAIAGDRLAQGIARTLTSRARDNARFYGAPGPEAMPATVEEHKRILDAIIAGDSETAAREMNDHITQAWERRRIPAGS